MSSSADRVGTARIAAGTGTGPLRRLVPLLLLVCVLVPAHGPLFSGIPLTTPMSLLALVIALFLLFSQDVARSASGLLTQARVPVLLLAGALIALAVTRLAFGFAVAPAGFAGCYRPLTGAVTPSQDCAVVYDNPLRRGGVTRFDETLTFAQRGTPGVPPSRLVDSEWNLSFFNSLEFNDLPGGGETRDRLPFGVEWTGRVDHPPGSDLLLQYVGEGVLEVDGQTRMLPRSYSAPGTVTVPFPPGQHDLRLEFQFDPRPDDAGPYAMVQLLRTGDEIGTSSVSTERPLGARAVGWLLDLALGLVLAGAALALLRALSQLLPVALWAVPGTAAATAGAVLRGPSGYEHVLMAVVVVLTPVIAVARGAGRRGLAPLAGLLALAYSIGRVAAPAGLPLGLVEYRSLGDDFLTYESQARDILESLSFQGGEDVFVYSPGMRYLLFLEHLLFGDGDRPLYVANTALLVLGCTWAFFRLAPTGGWRFARWGRPGPVARVRAWSQPVLGLVALAVLVAYVATDAVTPGSSALLSEFPTWTCLLFAVPLAITCSGRRELLLVSALLGLSVFLRSEQAPGAAVVWVIAAVSYLRPQPGVVSRVRSRLPLLVASGALVLIGPMLTASHNLAFGDELAFLPQTPRLEGNFPLPPERLLEARYSAEARDVLRSQVAGLLVLPQLDAQADVSQEYIAVVRLIQLGLLAALASALWRLRRRPLLWLAVPGALLLPHLFIQVYVYYPRHVVAGYLTAALVCLAFVGRAVGECTTDPVGPRAGAAPASGPAEPLDGLPEPPLERHG